MNKWNSKSMAMLCAALLTTITIFAQQGLINGNLADSAGWVIYAAIVKEATHTINVSKAARGVYFVQVKQNDLISTKKIMKN